MARKRKTATPEAAVAPVYPLARLPGVPIRGRPPGEPKTALARWIQQHGITVTDFAAELRSVAKRVGIGPESVPETKTLRDIVNLRHRASLECVKLVRHATGGEVDLDHWIDDLTAR